MSATITKGEVAEDVSGAIFMIVLLGGLIFLIGGCLAQVARPSALHVNYHTRDYLRAEFGLDPTKIYHLRLGAATGGGIVGSFHSESDFILFSGHASASAQLTPSSAIRLGFTLKGASYIVEIPYAKVQFKQVDGVRSTVKFVINNGIIDYRSRQNVGHHYFTYEQGHLQKARDVHVWQTDAWGRIRKMGLPVFLNNHLYRVILTVTPQQYNAYLGSLQTTKG